MKKALITKALALLVLLALVPSAWALAMESDTTSPPDRTIIKRLMYVDADELGPMMELLGVGYVIDPGGDNALVLRAPGPILDQALKAIEALDTPAPTIELSFFVLGVSKDRDNGTNVPPDIIKAVSELQRVFGYTKVELLESAVLTVQNGRPGRVQGRTPYTAPSGQTSSRNYSILFNSAALVPEDGGPTVRIRGFRYEGQNINLATDVEVKEGQIAVVGKSSATGVDSGVVVVVKARADHLTASD